jgi:hypothetical protein
VAQHVRRLARGRVLDDPARQQLLDRVPGARDDRAGRGRQLMRLADPVRVQVALDRRVELDVLDPPRPLDDVLAAFGPHPRDLGRAAGEVGRVLDRAEAELVRDGAEVAVDHCLGATSAYRSCRRARIWSGVYAWRLRSSRAIRTPVAATPTSPAIPNHFHQRMSLG